MLGRLPVITCRFFTFCADTSTRDGCSMLSPVVSVLITECASSGCKCHIYRRSCKSVLAFQACMHGHDSMRLMHHYSAKAIEASCEYSWRGAAMTASLKNKLPALTSRHAPLRRFRTCMYWCSRHGMGMEGSLISPPSYAPSLHHTDVSAQGEPMHMPYAWWHHTCPGIAAPVAAIEHGAHASSGLQPGRPQCEKAARCM